MQLLEKEKEKGLKRISRRYTVVSLEGLVSQTRKKRSAVPSFENCPGGGSSTDRCSGTGRGQRQLGRESP